MSWRILPLALMIWGAAAQAEPADLCARGARAGPVTLDYLLQLEALEDVAAVYTRADFAAFPLGDDADAVAYAYATMLPVAIEWPGVLADRAASLPKAAHDLPWLIMLAQVEADSRDPIYSLTQDAQSILTPDLLPLLERNGLTEEARVLRLAVALFPDWPLDPAERIMMVTDLAGRTVDQTLRAGLDAAARGYPTGQHRAATAALRLIAANPEVQRTYDGRLKGLDDRARLDWLLSQLREDCLAEWYTLQEADRAYSGIGSVQAALLLMEDLAVSLEGQSLGSWFDSPAATMTPQLANVLDRRGLHDLALGLRQGMAVFPEPFPRDPDQRWNEMGAMDGGGLARFDALMPPDAYDRIYAEMARLARENGLFPG